jgi:DNA-binding NarL/FixJ family response regulator
MPAISVMILSHDRILAEALEFVLAGEGDLSVVTAARGRERAGAGDPSAVDIVLVDAARDRDAALAMTWRVRERFTGAQVIVFGLDREDESAVDFIEAGAEGYVLKNVSPAALAEAIRAVRSGRALCSPHIATSVLERIARLSQEDVPAAGPVREPLTPREAEVLALMSRGLRNKEIARALRITVQTVKNHVHNLLAKLEVHRRRDAVRLAYELRLLGEPEAPLDLF